ncbi:MAG: hypothetical protein HGA53_09725, partial [Anaerolineaceae bacterium]|nr:hypothetical protein [Anaerolineaceae bacterium]
MTTKSTFDPPLSRVSHFLLAVSFIFLLLLGLAVRLTDLKDLPLDFHSTRQMFSALNMRGMVYQTLTNVPEWQRDRAV